MGFKLAVFLLLGYSCSAFAGGQELVFENLVPPDRHWSITLMEQGDAWKVRCSGLAGHGKTALLPRSELESFLSVVAKAPAAARNRCSGRVEIFRIKKFEWCRGTPRFDLISETFLRLLGTCEEGP